MAIPTAAAGILKVGTAKAMAKALKHMKETDWTMVESAMQSMRQFGESASLIQETLTDIKDQADALVNIALGTAMSQLAIVFNDIFVTLEPLATGIDKLVIALENLGIKVFAVDERVEKALEPPTDMLDVGQLWHDFWHDFWHNLFPDIFPDVTTPTAPPTGGFTPPPNLPEGY